MQVLRLLSAVILAVGLIGLAVARAEETRAVEIGHSGLSLPNSALGQDRHYLKQDEDLLGRIACLLQDVDALLAELHALPPEWAGTEVTTEPAADELAWLIDLALTHNPELLPYRSELAVQAARTRQAGAKSDPMLTLNLANFPLPQFDPEDTPMTQVILGWSQKYEGYGKRGLRRSIAQLEEDLTELDRAQAELELIERLSGLYFAMVGTRARLDVTAESTALLDLLIEFARGKYALGITPQAQLLQLEIERTRLEQQRIELSSLLAEQGEMLTGLVGHNAGLDPNDLALELEYPLPQPADWDREQLLGAALARRPDYQRLAITEDQQQLEVELAHREYRPDYTVSASYGTRWGKRDFFSVGVSVPLFTHKAERQDAKVQEAYAALDVTDGTRAALSNGVSTRLGTLLVELNRVAELSALYREGLLPQARLALSSAISGYAANRIDLADLLRAQQTLLSYELELEQQYIDYLAAVSETYIITGGAFDPGPWLAERLVLDGDSVASTLAGAEELLIAGAQVAAAGRPPVTSAPAPVVPPSGRGFVEGLRLPQSAGQAEAPATRQTPEPPVTDGQLGDAADELEASEGEGTGDDGAGFYEPFEPQDQESGND